MLVRQAFQFSEEGSTVSVTARLMSGSATAAFSVAVAHGVSRIEQLRFEIADNGPGEQARTVAANMPYLLC